MAMITFLIAIAIIIYLGYFIWLTFVFPTAICKKLDTIIELKKGEK